MNIFDLTLLILFAIGNGPMLHAEDFAAERAQVLALGQLTTPPAMQPARAIPTKLACRRSSSMPLPWQGKPTKVFAWLGLPKNRAGKVPGVVLVHGGGGTAFKEWVQKWNDHGFAAISIAVEGRPIGATPTNSTSLAASCVGRPGA